MRTSTTVAGAAALLAATLASSIDSVQAVPLFAQAAQSFMSDAGPQPSTSASATTSAAGANSTNLIGSMHNSNSSSWKPLNQTAKFFTCTTPGTFAMTFDDGPQPNEAGILSLLEQNNITGTFFVNGNNWDCIYDDNIVAALRATYAAGHQIATHTWGHTHSANLTSDQFNNQLNLIEDALVKILGIRPAFYRPPYGEISDANMAVLQNRGYSAAIIWDQISGPGTGTAVPQSLANYAAGAKSYPQPHIFLNHEQDDIALQQIYPQVIPEIKAAGYKMVSVSQCLGIPPYQWVGQPQQKDATWTCVGKPGPGQAQ